MGFKPHPLHGRYRLGLVIMMFRLQLWRGEWQEWGVGREVEGEGGREGEVEGEGGDVYGKSLLDNNFNSS